MVATPTKEELISLSEFAKKFDCKGIVLVPLNTGEFINKIERIKLLYNSLKNITPILNDYGLLGYIEPLGFEISSLRLKSEVAEVIENSIIQQASTGRLKRPMNDDELKAILHSMQQTKKEFKFKRI